MVGPWFLQECFIRKIFLPIVSVPLLQPMLKIASLLARKANIPYFKIALDEEYTQKESLQNGLEFIYNSSGMASFSRAHYLYAAKALSSKTDVLVTGNFGSEVFRAVHNPGVVFSQNLISLFDSDSVEEALEKVENSVEFSYYTKRGFFVGLGTMQK